MKKQLLVACISLLIFGQTYSQNGCQGRYQFTIFAEAEVESGVQYGENANPTFTNPNARQNLAMDIYRPKGDTVSKRPLLILAFGGAFVIGARISPDIVHLCTEFAKLGYVTAAIDYRLTPDLLAAGNDSLASMAVLKASHDMRAAVRFFYKDAATTRLYGVDTTRIIVGGVSAGALAALHTAYLDKLSEIPAVLAADTATINSIGGIEGLSGNPGYSSKVGAVLNLCGAISDVHFIEPNDPVLVSMHGTNDNTVPYGHDTIPLFNLDLVVDGSGAIHDHLDTANLNIKHALYTWQGAGHTPFLNFISIVPTYMDTTFRFTRDFLYDWVCSPGVSIQLDLEANTIRVYPNPASDQLFLALENTSLKGLTLWISDLQGRKMQIAPQVQGSEIRIDLDGWNPGLYFWHIQDERGERLGSGKMVVR